MLFSLSLISLLLPGCYVAKGTKALDIFTNCPAVFTTPVGTARFTTQIDFYKKHLSGLMIFKATNDTTERVVFMTETGFKFFDLEFTPHSSSVMYLIPSLNKRIIVKTLIRDLGYLATPPLENSPHDQPKSDSNTTFRFPRGGSYDYYVADKQCRSLQRIASGTETKKNLVIDFSNSGSQSHGAINIAHQNVKLTIFLRQIDMQ